MRPARKSDGCGVSIWSSSVLSLLVVVVVGGGGVVVVDVDLPPSGDNFTSA